MLKVSIELISARTGQVTEIGRTYIANIGGTQERGDYTAVVCRKGNFHVPLTQQGEPTGGEARAAKVTNYPRLSYNVWRLVIRALRGCFPEEKGQGELQIPDQVVRGMKKMADTGDPEVAAALLWIMGQWK